MDQEANQRFSLQIYLIWERLAKKQRQGSRGHFWSGLIFIKNYSEYINDRTGCSDQEKRIDQNPEKDEDCWLIPRLMKGLICQNHPIFCRVFFYFWKEEKTSWNLRKLLKIWKKLRQTRKSQNRIAISFEISAIYGWPWSLKKDLIALSLFELKWIMHYSNPY